MTPPRVEHTVVNRAARAAGREASTVIDAHPIPYCPVEQYAEPKGAWNFVKSLLKVLEHVYRAVPVPTHPRLIRIGNPGRKAPVLVRGAFAVHKNVLVGVRTHLCKVLTHF